LTRHFDYAQQQQAKYVGIIGNNELTNQTINLKDQKTLNQQEVKIIDLQNFLSKNF